MRGPLMIAMGTMLAASCMAEPPPPINDREPDSSARLVSIEIAPTDQPFEPVDESVPLDPVRDPQGGFVAACHVRLVAEGATAALLEESLVIDATLLDSQGEIVAYEALESDLEAYEGGLFVLRDIQTLFIGAELEAQLSPQGTLLIEASLGDGQPLVRDTHAVRFALPAPTATERGTRESLSSGQRVLP